MANRSVQAKAEANTLIQVSTKEQDRGLRAKGKDNGAKAKAEKAKAEKAGAKEREKESMA